MDSQSYRTYSPTPEHPSLPQFTALPREHHRDPPFFNIKHRHMITVSKETKYRMFPVAPFYKTPPFSFNSQGTFLSSLQHFPKVACDKVTNMGSETSPPCPTFVESEEMGGRVIVRPHQARGGRRSEMCACAAAEGTHEHAHPGPLLLRLLVLVANMKLVIFPELRMSPKCQSPDLAERHLQGSAGNTATLPALGKVLHMEGTEGNSPGLV